MAERRLASVVLAVTGTVLLPLSLFLDWFRVDTARTRRPAPDRVLLVTGATALAIVVIQLIDKPPLLGFGLHVSLRIGAVLGLAGAMLVLAAGALQAFARSGLRQPE